MIIPPFCGNCSASNVAPVALHEQADVAAEEG